MRYMMKYLDASRHVMMSEIIESDGDTEYTIRQSCEKAAKRYEQMKQRLSEKIPYVRPTQVFYEINGREGTVYSKAGDEKIIIEIQVCTPIGLLFHKTPERSFRPV